MSVSTLAIRGGRPVRTRPFARYNTIGAEEKRAVLEVLDSGVLSQFMGTAGPDFLGGPRVRGLEEAWAGHFGVRHAVSVNSATSGLYAALGAAGVGPGDEVLVSPYTMSASAAGAVVYGATPVFVDIDPQTYCMSIDGIRAAITPRTRAIVVVDLFGQPAEFDAITALARDHDLIVIEDAAQAPGAQYKGRWAGTLGNIGVFSLNYHKTIHSGEGGIVVTNDDELADRVRLIRNHGEVIQRERGAGGAPLVGFNYRMTEIEAAIAREQLRKLEMLTVPRIEAAAFLRRRWTGLPGLTPAAVRNECRHVYYVFALDFDGVAAGVTRKTFIDAVAAEGVRLAPGYVEPLYRQPLYARYGYTRGLCPVTETMYESRLLYTGLVHAALDKADLEDVALAVEKVATNARLLVGAPTVEGAGAAP
jgi:perosamine synthetase